MVMVINATAAKDDIHKTCGERRIGGKIGAELSNPSLGRARPCPSTKHGFYNQALFFITPVSGLGPVITLKTFDS
jgi:hypothetical protein